jgi:acetoin utilization deacetylase AcuC-like enzyme
MTLHHWLKEFRKQNAQGKLPVDLIFFQAGVDILEVDRLGRMDLSPKGVARRNEMVYEFAYGLNVPLVICMGGGYPRRMNDYGNGGWEPIIDAHANVYVQAHQFLSKKLQSLTT